MPRAQDATETILNNYIPVPWSGCWLWLGPVDKEGYGVLYAGGKHMKAHRFSLALHRGEPPVKLHACHTCDVPGCINPDHLFWGTDADNKKDSKAKGRSRNAPRLGAAHSLAKLSDDDVIFIRASVLRTAELAAKFHVCHQTIRNIQLRKNWRHL